MLHIDDILETKLDVIINDFFEKRGKFEVEFHDGILELSSSQIILDRIILNYVREIYGWNRLNPQYLTKYSVSKLKVFKPDSMLDICSKVYKDFMVEHGHLDDGGAVTNHMNEFIYSEVVNVLYNFYVTHLQSYTQGANTLDIIDIIKRPAIEKANNKLLEMVKVPEPSDISAVHDVIKETIMNDPALDDNPFAIALRCGAIKMNQMAMVVGPIGFTTDVNTKLFPNPLRNGYYRGGNELWEILIESRNASIATIFNALNLPLSQYANRQYQLFSQAVRHVVTADCGATYLKETYVTDKKMLKALAGLWRLDEKTNELVVIDGDEEELIDTTIKHRFVTHCIWNASRSEVCSKCYGELHKAITKTPAGKYTDIKGRNIGHIAAITIGGQSSSIVLARKHASDTSTAVKYQFNEDQEMVLQLSSCGRYMLVNTERFSIHNLSINLVRNQITKVIDMVSGIKVKMPESKLTQIEIFQVDVKETDGTILHRIPISLGSKHRAGYLSREFVNYIVEHGCGFDGKDIVTVSLANWNPELPLFVVPQAELTPPEFISNLASFILGSAKKDKTMGSSRQDKALGLSPKNDDGNIRRLCDFDDTGSAVDGLYSEISDQLSVHYTHLGVIVLGMSINSEQDDDYRLPFPRHTGKVMRESPILNHNSAGMQMAYEDQGRILSVAKSFVYHRRRGHPMDRLLLSEVYGNCKDL